MNFYLGCFLPDVPNCSFIGGCFGFAAVPRIAELQAKAAVNVISGMSRLPSPETMRRRIKRALAFHVQKVRRSRIEIAREVSRVSNLRPISVSASRRGAGASLGTHLSLPTQASRDCAFPGGGDGKDDDASRESTPNTPPSAASLSSRPRPRRLDFPAVPRRERTLPLLTLPPRSQLNAVPVPPASPAPEG